MRFLYTRDRANRTRASHKSVTLKCSLGFIVGMLAGFGEALVGQ
jgi:hypothetical protein